MFPFLCIVMFFFLLFSFSLRCTAFLCNFFAFKKHSAVPDFKFTARPGRKETEKSAVSFFLFLSFYGRIRHICHVFEIFAV